MGCEMLVLSRKLNESVIIGDAIQVTILNINRDKVKLGISAPRNIPVHRKEVYDLIQKENITASKVMPDRLDRFLNFFKPFIFSKKDK